MRIFSPYYLLAPKTDLSTVLIDVDFWVAELTLRGCLVLFFHKLMVYDDDDRKQHFASAENLMSIIVARQANFLDILAIFCERGHGII